MGKPAEGRDIRRKNAARARKAVEEETPPAVGKAVIKYARQSLE